MLKPLDAGKGAIAVCLPPPGIPGAFVGQIGEIQEVILTPRFEGESLPPVTGVYLIYVYRHRVTEEAVDVSALTIDKLLLPPVFINRMPWSKGFFKTVAHAEFTPHDRLQHPCYWNSARMSYVDENDVPITLEEDHVPGVWGLVSYRWLDDRISDALRFERVPEDVVPVLGINGVVGGVTPANDEWTTAISDLFFDVMALREGVASSAKLNIEFHVPGNLFVPEFDGVRIGAFRESDNLLKVQVALPAEAPANARAEVLSAMERAFDAADSWAGEQREPFVTVVLRELVAALKAREE
ncbi:hypothetical protein FHX49_000488 [Microbacterium endophyticum]|uniref:Uncharacterized protein n=1 Tax=Microbacterium endophyticum TaxID=1526412 RepID=A0A7W4YMB6_9MICO|nr:Imm26 family immunity protein [Microbacterium endophyticum]MBB2974947.1 hypothetical protein [Microbacterium endophyticum]NIK37244.1 hypothetical protein [Microbacterium endophyticum]